MAARRQKRGGPGRALAAQEADTPARAARTFEVLGDDFVLDGRPHRIISGSVSYFRVLPTQWHDRLEKLKALGCNTAEVYVPWNLHEPSPGQYRFDGRRDLAGFLALCQELGIDVLLRPGPYICAEWDLGGLPWWLLNRADPVPLRSSDTEFLSRVEAWWLKELLPRVKPYLCGNGGPILAVQVENECGYWGRDTAYLERLKALLQEGFDPICPLLFTSDGPFSAELLRNGQVDGALVTANFGSDAAGRLAVLRQVLPIGPLVNMEFWVGWFDVWGSLTGKSYRDPADVAQTLREALEGGASVNFFVFHGGTSFGFCGPGANISDNLQGLGRYEPQVTSYDYGGLLDEAGEVTEKYLRCREVLAEFLGRPELLQVQFPKSQRLPASPPLELESSLSLEATLETLSSELPAVKAALPLTAEQLGCGYGYVLYRSESKVQSGVPLQLASEAVRDFATVLANGEVLGTVYRNDDGKEFTLPEGDSSLDILVEIMGRVNFGVGMLAERKGLVGRDSVWLGPKFAGLRRAVFGWHCQPLPMGEEVLAKLPWGTGQGAQARSTSWKRGPRFFLYTLFLGQPADGYLVLNGCTKGFACVNGFNLGRYWEVGPQLSLFIPKPLLRRGRNEILVFDIDHPGKGAPEVRVVPDAVWGSGALPAGTQEIVGKSSGVLTSVGKALRGLVD